MHRVSEKLRFGDALPIVHQNFGFGLGASRILLSKKPMGGQMQNVGRLDLKQRFFCRGVLGEVDRRPTPAYKLLNKFITLYLRALQTPEAPIFDFPLFAAADGAR